LHDPVRPRAVSLAQETACRACSSTRRGIAGGDRFGIDIVAGEAAAADADDAGREILSRLWPPARPTHHRARAEAGAKLPGCRRRPFCSTGGAFRAHRYRTGGRRPQLLLCEIVVFGRAAMAMYVHGEFIDRWRLPPRWPAVFRRTIRLDGDIGAKLAQPRHRQWRRAIGTALIVPGDAAMVERIREAADSFGGEVGIRLDGFAMARFCGPRCSPAPRRHEMFRARPRLQRAAAKTLVKLGLWLN